MRRPLRTKTLLPKIVGALEKARTPTKPEHQRQRARIRTRNVQKRNSPSYIRRHRSQPGVTIRKSAKETATGTRQRMQPEQSRKKRHVPSREGDQVTPAQPRATD